MWILKITYADTVSSQGYPDRRTADRAYRSFIRNHYQAGYQTTVEGGRVVILDEDASFFAAVEVRWEEQHTIARAYARNLARVAA